MQTKAITNKRAALRRRIQPQGLGQELLPGAANAVPSALQRTLANPNRATSADVLTLQRGLGNRTVQRVMGSIIQLTPLVKDKLNVVGEIHPDSDARRGKEKTYCTTNAGSSNYWTEAEFKDRAYSVWTDWLDDRRNRADPFRLRWDQAQAFLTENARLINSRRNGVAEIRQQKRWLDDLNAHLHNLDNGTDGFSLAPTDARRGKAMRDGLKAVEAAWQNAVDNYPTGHAAFYAAAQDLGTINPIQTSAEISTQRGLAMDVAAKARSAERGVWKIGDAHRRQIQDQVGAPALYNLVDEPTFSADLP